MSLDWTRLPWQAGLWSVLRTERPNTGHHALLIHGPEGIGKLRLARALAASLLCDLPGEDLTACGHCPACEWLHHGHHPDYRELTTPSRRIAFNAGEESEESGADKKLSEEIRIEDIRQLSSFFSVTTHRGGLRVIVIHPADALNTSAANALLKTLEEPIPGTRFILVTDRPQRLPPTIVSRCLPIAISLPPRDQALHWLRAEGVRDAEMLLDRFAGRALAAKDATESRLEEEERFINALAQLKGSPLAISEKSSKENLKDWVYWLQCWCHDLMMYPLLQKVRFYPNHQARLADLSQGIVKSKLIDWEQDLRRAAYLVQEPVNPKLMMDTLLMSYAALLKYSSDK